MFGKIVRLLGIPMEDGFEVIYGAEFDIDMAMRLNFATIFIGGTREPGNYTYVYGGISLRKEYDLYKDLDVFKMPDEYIDEKNVEDTLVVIIPYSSEIKTTAKRIAGRYSTEAILEMHAGDTVIVNKGGAVPETYMAVQAGNELLLVKKYR